MNATVNPAPIQTDLGAIFVSLELSRSTWLVTSLSPASGEKMSKFSVIAGDAADLLSRMSVLRDKALHRTGRAYPIITIQEAGLDGFWLHRLLTREGIESNVVDPASITVSRRRRQAKTDRLDGETLLRALMAHKRGDPRLRVTLVQSAWLWLRHQPNSALSKWFRERTQANHGRRKKSTIVALARKLLVALWKYVTSGVLIEGVITNKV